MEELAELTRTAGGEVAGVDVQRRDEVDPALFIGRGKVEELRALQLDGGFDIVICNDDLSPRQQRNLEAELKCRVVDRTELILDIFAQHARTREGRLQVESALLHHTLPRLIGAWSYNRQVGGIGARGGPGEQQIEVERRRIRRRLKDLEREIEEVQRQRGQQRAGRQRSELPTVAIVGYTNAGKSTVMNALTGAAIRAENRLFATLDPTTRRIRLPSGREVLLTDTVGFIQKLPTDLVAAFRATLEEATHADLVLEVVDLADPARLDHAETVEQVLEQLDAAGKPRVVALNKVDLLGPATRRRALQEMHERFPDAVEISAARGTGLDRLLEAIDRESREDVVEVDLLVPYGAEAVLHDLRTVGGIQSTEYESNGTRARGWVPRRSARRFERYAAGSPG
jgi:GTP-binding protein HflX